MGTSVTGGSDGGSALPLPPALQWKREHQVVTMRGIWGSGINDIYAVGMSGALLHSNGDGKWRVQDSKTGANLYGVWGSGPGDVYVAADANVTLHSAGDGTWVHELYDDGYTFKNVWGLGPDQVYAVGPGVVRRVDGTRERPTRV